MDCYLMTFDPNADATYTKTTADRLIGLRSKYTHSEFQFSQRYNCISASATMADLCRCFRFKNIDYSKHPARWKRLPVALNNDQEDAILELAMDMADYHDPQILNNCSIGEIYYGPKALKYDLLGVSFSFILPKLRIWRPHYKWVWCSEACCLMLQQVFPSFNGRADEQSPESLLDEWAYFIKDSKTPTTNPVITPPSTADKSELNQLHFPAAH